jgi:hypothetical protein
MYRSGVSLSRYPGVQRAILSIAAISHYNPIFSQSNTLGDERQFLAPSQYSYIINSYRTATTGNSVKLYSRPNYLMPATGWRQRRQQQATHAEARGARIFAITV